MHSQRTEHMHTNAIRLVAFDMEGCLTSEPSIWELMHRKLRTWDSHGHPYWQRYLQGEFHYDDFARMDVAVWRGAPAALLDEAATEVPLMPGCREALRALRGAGVRMVIISNGLMRLADRFVREFGFESVCANRAVVEGRRLTGEIEIAVPYDDKARVLADMAARLGVCAGQTAAVGDSAADVPMFEFAALAVAVQPADDAVAAAASHVLGEGDLSPLPRLLLGRSG